MAGEELPQILEFAWGVAQEPLAEYGETETHVRVRPKQEIRLVPPPAYLACDGVAAELVAVAGLVARLVGEGIPERDIAVL